MADFVSSIDFNSLLLETGYSIDNYLFYVNL